MTTRGGRLAVISVLVFFGCGGTNAPRAGVEDGPCLPNDTCSAGLTCLSTLCVRVVSGGTDAGANGGIGGGAAGQGGGGSGADAGVAGAGGAGAGGADAGSAGTDGFTPAAHPDLPQVGTLGGPVLVAPKVRPILYAGDSATGDIESFLQELAHTSYWSATTAEYGVGGLTVLPPIVMTSVAPAVTTDDALKALVISNTTGSDPPWGAPDPNVVYLFVVPAGATVNIDNNTCCDDFGGYHSEVSSGGIDVPYAVGCTCPGFFGIAISPLDERTTAISHELVEAATDPFPSTNPAYSIEDRADIIWSVINGGGEVGDMCAFNDDAAFVPEGSKYMVQRTWSDAAAKKMQNPCVPYATSAAYFNSFPALEAVTVGADNFATRGVRVPVGQSRTIDVNLFSAAATKGPWTVTAYDYDYWFLGAAPKLTLTLDKAEGLNGDKLRLTIAPNSVDQALGGEAFVLISHYGTVRDPDYQTNLTITLVTN